MTLDQIEADAKSTVFVVEHYGMDAPSQQRAYDLARAVLAMLPIVRAALQWRTGHDTEANGHRFAIELAEAVDAMRGAMEGK